MDPERIRQIEAELANPADLTDERIAELQAELTGLLRDIAAESPTTESVAALRALDGHLTALNTAAEERAADVAALEAEVAEIMERAGTAAAEDPEPEEPETPAEAVDEPAEVVDEPVEEPEPVTAAALPSLGEIAARRPARHAPRPAAEPRGPRAFVASEGLDAALGAEFTSNDDVVKAFIRKHDHIASSDATSGEFSPILSVRDDAWANRPTLGNDPEASTKTILDAYGVSSMRELVNEPDAMKALTASGGLCAPVAAYYGQAHVGDSGRPVAGSLPGFGADRGGIRFVPPVTLPTITADQAGAAITTITMAQDAASKAKTKQTVTCPAITEVDYTALALRLGFGNVSARTFPERVTNILQVAQDQFSRVKERRLLTQIGAGSTVVSTAQVYGTVRDLLGNVARAAAGYRNRHRMNPEAPLRVIMPVWALDAMQADIANMYGSSDLEHFGVSDGDIESYFNRLAVNITWARDGEIAKGAGLAQDYGTQSGLSSGLLDFPDNLVWYLFHEGAWLYLNGGQIDLGLVRDSTLNSTNDYEVMEESFEDVAFVGVESLKIISPICSNGSGPLGVIAGACSNKVGFGS